MNTEVREKLRVAMIMALSAGFMDGFTFFHFDGRFAGAQTGNMIQAGIALAQAHYVTFIDFMIPIICFMIGVMFKVVLSTYLVRRRKFDALYMLMIQLVGLTIFSVLYAAVWHIPSTYCVGVLSFFMAIQYDTFNKAHGLTYTSVFTTGNLKVFSVNLTQWLLTRNKENLHAVRILSCIIPTFFIGAFLATLAGKVFGAWTLLGSCLLYFIVFLIYRVEG